jgi:hypothetical protein
MAYVVVEQQDCQHDCLRLQWNWLFLARDCLLVSQQVFLRGEA